MAQHSPAKLLPLALLLRERVGVRGRFRKLGLRIAPSPEAFGYSRGSASAYLRQRPPV